MEDRLVTDLDWLIGGAYCFACRHWQGNRGPGSAYGSCSQLRQQTRARGWCPKWQVVDVPSATKEGTG